MDTQISMLMNTLIMRVCMYVGMYAVNLVYNTHQSDLTTVVFIHKWSLYTGPKLESIH